ncbi:hypothetical protein CUMW_186060, partial [Citrus unshiu]
MPLEPSLTVALSSWLHQSDNTNDSSESTPKTDGGGLNLVPVSPEESGEGLPYAPINWPNPGDNWSWKVGRRVTNTGHFLDRYLCAPRHLPRLENEVLLKKRGAAFASKLSVERYIRTAFPGADINAFFASFSWKIPAVKNLSRGKAKGFTSFPPVSREVAEHSLSHLQSEGIGCKAGNKMCNSLLVQPENPSLAAVPCEFCCNEPRFCRDCCCILCSKTISLKHGGYSYIKCEATVGEGYVCGHIAHLNCALRCYMAGTVGGSIGLDAEYCCRRCDAKTDLVSHVTRSIEVCKSVDSLEDVEKFLNLGVCVLRGSQKTSAKELLIHIEQAIAKLKSGASIEDIWKVGDIDVAISKEESLHVQRNYLHNLYEQLDKEKAELAHRTSNAEPDELLNAILNREDQIKREVLKLREMEKVANGFGRASKRILKEYFDTEIEE